MRQTDPPSCLSETGGLFRVAVKLMMACATKNMDVYVTRGHRLFPLNLTSWALGTTFLL
jgi:hypothetical protein